MSGRKKGRIGGAELRREIGRNLKAARKRRRLTQADIGVALDISTQQVQKYERGVNNLTLAAAVLLRNAFGITLAELVPLRPDATEERLEEIVESLGRLLDDVRRIE